MKPRIRRWWMKYKEQQKRVERVRPNKELSLPSPHRKHSGDEKNAEPKQETPKQTQSNDTETDNYNNTRAVEQKESKEENQHEAETGQESSESDESRTKEELGRGEENVKDDSTEEHGDTDKYKDAGEDTNPHDGEENTNERKEGGILSKIMQESNDSEIGDERSNNDGDIMEEVAKLVSEYGYPVKNTGQVVELATPRASVELYYMTAFQIFLERIAEVDTTEWLYDVPEKYNVRKLIMRKYERRPLKHYRGRHRRESIVMILDNSGSMSYWENMLTMMSTIGLMRGDIEIYAAPNGVIKEKITKNARIPVSHNEVMSNLNGRIVIYVGDFDGADTAIELSWRNKVIWVCTEDRYRYFRSHDWVSYSESDFKGVFLRVWNIDEMLEALKKVPYITEIWIDFHVNDTYRDDEPDDDYYEDDYDYDEDDDYYSDYDEDYDDDYDY